MADLAEHAYAHASAVLGDGEPAVEAAILGVRRGGRSRAAVLGHTRAAVLSRAADATAEQLDLAAPTDLAELAVLLGATRPSLERVVVDLETRHGLDRGGFARAIGLPVAAAGTRAGAVLAEWERQLDPVVLARLGAGECDGLAAVLVAEGVTTPRDIEAGDEVPADDNPPTVRALLSSGPGVADHVAGCELCRDRLRAMVSVRTLLGQRPIPIAPAPVRNAIIGGPRLRRPTPPPPLESEAARRPWRLTAAVVVAVFAVAITAGVLTARRPAGGPGRVEALTKVPAAGNALSTEPASLEGTLPPPVELRNDSSDNITWTASGDVPWLTARPAAGELAPGDVVPVRLIVGAGVPEGEVRGAMTISSDDGSTTVVRLHAIIEHPPDVAASVNGCDVTGTVEDESEVRAVVLRWTDGQDRTQTLGAGTNGYAGRLPNSAGPMTWWVEATDARGNVARTPDAVLAPNSCPAT